jgi:hypothetical protein
MPRYADTKSPGSGRAKTKKALLSLLGIIAPLAIVAAVLTALGTRREPALASNLGAFAGYTWTGSVHSVHAAWRVPEIKEGSPCGSAATWIGASTEGQGFIQIGIDEQCLKPAERSLGLPLEASFWAFWSDTEKGDHPRLLYEVRAGDLIEATATLSQKIWRLTITDRSTGSHSSFRTVQETERIPISADWFQEDPLEPSKYALYPQLSEVRLSDVLVNGRQPGQEELESAELNLGQETLVPSPLRNDSFSIEREK